MYSYMSMYSKYNYMYMSVILISILYSYMSMYSKYNYMYMSIIKILLLYSYIYFIIAGRISI